MINTSPTEEQINKLLPQTQCQQCGHAGCAPYAQAITQGEPINRCPPGGTETIAQLAALLKVNTLPLDTRFGEHKGTQLALIREAECIGCTKCIQVCPTDAILGAGKRMHSVIASECTGCELCVPACPVDCIDIIPAAVHPASDQAWHPNAITAFNPQRARYWQSRYETRQQRLQSEKDAAASDSTSISGPVLETSAPGNRAAGKSAQQLKLDIAAAVARSKRHKAMTKQNPG